MASGAGISKQEESGGGGADLQLLQGGGVALQGLG